MKYIIALLSVFLIIGCVGNTTTPQTNNTINTPNNLGQNDTLISPAPVDLRGVIKGDNVSVDYTGSLENGTIFDTSIGRAPLEFTAGVGQMIKGFDDAVIGMRPGDEKNVTIKAADAYGEIDPNNVIVVPVENVPNNTKVGDTLYSGSRPVKVINVTKYNVTIDVNHPLAGKTLIFDIKLLKIS